MAENGKAKYYALMEEMKTDILSGKIRPGEKLPSENQLSVRYGLSRHTVRKALGILAGDGYIESFQGKGTFCADVLRQIHGTGNIAVVTTYISDYIFPRLIQGIDEVLSDNGYSIILKNTGNSRQKEARFLEELISKGIDGLIIEPSKSELLCRHVSLYETLDKYQIPYIFIQGLYTEMQEKPHILMDDAGGGYLVTKHLLDSGRRNIAGFFKADDRQGIERHKGYVKALQEHEIAYDPDKVVWFHTEDRRKKPALMVRNMVRQNSFPDGIVCYNDQIAVQVMEELEKRLADFASCQDKTLQTMEEVRRLLTDISVTKENGNISLTGGQQNLNASRMADRQSMDRLYALMKEQGEKQEALLEEMNRNLGELSKTPQKGKFGLFR